MSIPFLYMSAALLLLVVQVIACARRSVPLVCANAAGALVCITVISMGLV